MTPAEKKRKKKKKTERKPRLPAMERSKSLIYFFSFFFLFLSPSCHSLPSRVLPHNLLSLSKGPSVEISAVRISLSHLSNRAATHLHRLSITLILNFFSIGILPVPWAHLCCCFLRLLLHLLKTTQSSHIHQLHHSTRLSPPVSITNVAINVL